MRVTVDRLEGAFAVVEADEAIFNLPLALCPDAREGDTVEITVLPKDPKGEEPHTIFERLRKNSRRHHPPAPTSCKGENDPAQAPPIIPDESDKKDTDPNP